MMPALFTSLRQDAVLRAYLVAVDVNADAKGGRYADVFHQVPWATDPEYVNRILKISLMERVDIVIPGSDIEAYCLADARKRFDQIGVKLLASPADVLNLIRNKSATYATLNSVGIRVPEYACVANTQDLVKALSSFGYPEKNVVVKPVNGRGGRGMRLLTGNGLPPPKWIGGGAREKRIDTEINAENCHGWFEDGMLMVMPMMNEPAYDVDVFIHHGIAKAVLARRRLNPAGIPFTGNRIVSDPPLLHYCLEIAEALGLNALHDIDLLTDENGHPCLLEVNPRPSGSVAAAHAAGYPIMAVAVAETLNIPYPIVAPIKEIDLGVVPAVIPMVIPLDLT